MHGCAATPIKLMSALAAFGKERNMKDIELIHIHTEGYADCVEADKDGKTKLIIIFCMDIFQIRGFIYNLWQRPLTTC